MDVLANLVQSAPPTDKSLPSFTGGFSGFCYVLYSTLPSAAPQILHCVEGVLGSNPGNVMTLALAVRRCNHSARSHPSLPIVIPLLYPPDHVSHPLEMSCSQKLPYALIYSTWPVTYVQTFFFTGWCIL
jgi:hypothetical protein